MKKLLLLLLAALLFTACGKMENTNEETIPMNEPVYRNITAEEARQIMDSQEDYVILDVRSQEEYDQGHIPGAVVIPHTEMEAQAEQILPDKDQLLLVYCRSGRRSKLAAETLVQLGYTNILEFGGILDWPYEVE